MDDTVTIPTAEYERLRAAANQLSDFRAALAVEAQIAAGTEDLVPAG